MRVKDSWISSLAPRLLKKFADIQSFTKCKDLSDSMQESICYHAGPWRIIKPRDLERLFVNPEFQNDWNSLKDRKLDVEIKQSLESILIEYRDLTI
jgi:hypothetical protein